MSLLLKKKSKSGRRKESSSTVNKKRTQRLLKQANPNVGDGIYYTSQFETGLMHIVEKEYSRMYRIGELDYEISTEENQIQTVLGYAEGLNSIDRNSRYQLFVQQKRVPTNFLKDILLAYQGDTYDDLREEMNEIIESKYQKDQRNFTNDKYVVFTTKARDEKAAEAALARLKENFINSFGKHSLNLQMEEMEGVERLKTMSGLLRPTSFFSMSYRDMALAGLSSKAFIAPNRLAFPRTKNYFRLGERFGAVLYIRQYPKYLEDRLIKELRATGREFAISIHAKPYDMTEARKNIQSTRALNNIELSKQYKDSLHLPDDLMTGNAFEINYSAKSLMEEIKDNGQKLFSGIFTVFLSEESEQELEEAIKEIKDAGSAWQVEFEAVNAYKQEALNTILPIGKPYLDVEMNYMRDMTTSNVATHVPFSNIELQSPTGQFYGQNQLTKGIITVDRKEDLDAPSGIILGSSGSGKSMTTKWEVFTAFLRYPDRKFIIVDPEGEYVGIGKKLGAEILDIHTGTHNHLNMLGITDKRLLKDEDQKVDLVSEKANLLTGLFRELLADFGDLEKSIVSRVTRETYKRSLPIGQMPTLKEWHKVLLEQPEELAQLLAVKIEPYTIGSQNIFAHETNIDLSSRMIIFNIKHLDKELKSFAMRVILDQIWKQVVENQHKTTTLLYFDELQLNFREESSAIWFMELWSRVRKYGSVPTGITQEPTILLNSQAGRQLLSNTHFMILLKQQPIVLDRLGEIIKLTPKLIQYVTNNQAGTGLIASGGVIVPFTNLIPKQTKLFELMNTDA
ncbi:Type IV secretory pathway, VirB4 component [Pilibacter termitis]|uniref:Type IV secretory pathway, VirB4 component n=1 Tax=Pilibacter termitis TaxID=263852 RepID=A0A1T4KSY6_9ENTE|nr:TraC-F-type conjugal transfer protein [Pilibacter termitis]SJZ45460.1 Type IV secretory pathway, VirB4 component [Pilibacter termitis]